MGLTRWIAVVALGVIATGCTPTQRNKRIMSDFIFTASTVLTACDTGQTLSIARAGWPGTAHEGNWMLGEKPSTGALVGYNAGVMVANAAVYVAVPPKWKFAPPLVLGLVEAIVVIGNAMFVPRPLCGIR